MEKRHESTRMTSEQKELINELHGLPAASIEKEPTTVLSNLRRQKRVKAKL